MHGDYFLEISPQNTSLLQWLLLLIFSSFPNTTIITLKNFNNSGQRVSKFPQNFSKCPHNTIIPLSILNIFLKSPQNTLIPETLLLRSLEYKNITLTYLKGTLNQIGSIVLRNLHRFFRIYHIKIHL